VQKNGIWLNFSGTTPIPNFAKKTIAEFFDEYGEYGVFATRFTHSKVRGRILDHLGKLLHCDPNRIGLTHNTSEGMNLFSHSIDLKPNTKILVWEDEYPSNVYPWEHWKNKGVSIEFVKSGKSPEESEGFFLEKLKTSDVSLVSLSPVHWCTGIPLPLERIRKFCRENSIFFVIDGSQGVGNIPIDLGELEPDFLVSAAWKWLLGPLGLGFVYLSPKYDSTFRLLFKGQSTVTDDGNYLPYRDQWKTAPEQFEFSTISMQDWVYFFSTLELLGSIGWEKVFERRRFLSNCLLQEIHDLNLYSDLTPNKGVFSGIVTIQGHNSQKFTPEALQTYLRKNLVYTTVRLGRLRLAPHIPVTESHLSRLKILLQDFFSKQV